MKQGFQDMAQRIVNAEEAFAAVLIEISGCSRTEAFKVIATFRKLKAIKLDPVGGRISVKHGAYLEPEVIHRAINF